MLKRIITSIAALAVLLPILWFSDTYVFPIAISAVTCISLYEMYSCLGYKDKYAVTVPAYLSCIAMSFLTKISNGVDGMIPLMCSVIIVYLLYIMLLAVICHDKYKIQELSICYMTTIYIACGFLSIQFIKEMAEYTYLLVFVGAWITDIFAYFVGRMFGKHKLCEAISPKKTIEGSIGGTIFCSVAFLISGIIMLNGAGGVKEYVTLSIVGVIISFVSQIGDLSMSLIKRHYGIKDFGKIFPGHGGMLDRFDSILAVSTTLFVVISVLKLFNINILF